MTPIKNKNKQTKKRKQEPCEILQGLVQIPLKSFPIIRTESESDGQWILHMQNTEAFNLHHFG